MGLTLINERLILCEGSSDKTFFTELIRDRNLPDFQVDFPYGANETTGGIHMFQRFLEGISLENSFSIVKGILVVADNDNVPQDNFNLIVKQISDAGYGLVSNELQFAASPNGFPPVAIMMLPFNQQVGNLETVCKIAAYDKWNNLIPTLEAYFNESDAPNWTVGHQDKMKIQCLIAATCQSNPYCTISTLYRENEQYHIPLNHNCFDGIVQFLSDWDSLLPS